MRKKSDHRTILGHVYISIETARSLIAPDIPDTTSCPCTSWVLIRGGGGPDIVAEILSVLWDALDSARKKLKRIVSSELR